MQRFFYSIYIFANKNTSLFIAIAFSVVMVLGYFSSRIKLEENITQLIPSAEQSGLTSKILEQVNFADKITIVIESEKNGTPEELSAYANAFLDSVEVSCKPYVGKIQGKVDEENIQETIDFVYSNLPLFLDKNDYLKIQNKLGKDSISKVVEADYKSLVSPAGLFSKQFILQDPLGLSFIGLKKLQQLSIGDDFTLSNGYIVTKDQKHLLLFLTPKLAPNETDQNSIFVQNLEKIKTGLNTEFKGKTKMSYFGATPIAVANASQIKSDIQNTSIFATVSLILILIFFYRNLSIPLLIFVPSIFGAIFSLAVMYFLKGTVSVIALGISSVLLGETTDYSIYVLTHIREKKNIKLMFKDITQPLLLCGITTSISFLCLFFIKSEALTDLGIFACLSVLSTAIFSLILIPLIYRIKDDRLIPTPNIIDKLGAYSYHKNKYIIITFFVLLAISLFTYSKAGFNNDLATLNYMTPELKQTEKKLEQIANFSSKSVYLVSHGKSYEDALRTNEKLFESLQKDKESGAILSFSSIGGIVLSKEIQQKKIADWHAFWSAENKAVAKSGLITNGIKYGFKETTFSRFYETLDREFTPLSYEDFSKVKSLFLEEFIAAKNGLHTVSTLVKVPNEKRNEFVKRVEKNQQVVVIDRKATNEALFGSLKSNFQDLIDYTFLIIFVILFIAFKRIELVIVSIIPIMLSWILTTGIMGLFGIEFNVLNIILCTLIFGIGVDYSIFMTMALQKEHTYGTRELPTYRTSILLSVLTTFLGIGVLIFAKHPALKSISLIAIIGISSTLLITFIIQPLVFNFFVGNRVKKGQPPFEIRRLLHSSLSFTYYGLGSFLLSVFSTTLMRVLPISKKTKLKLFHALMSKFMESVLWTYPSNKRTIRNVHNEKFEDPAIIIANHNSFLDILAIGMLSPKIVFLVSDWVYNSPIFGKGVRLAGFYPVSSGIDNGIEHLRAKVEQGFSLMVFPEGTRSEDNVIKRFHKGAFYLAEELKLDIVPVAIHGYSEFLPKGDFIINGGKSTVEILPRISPTDSRYGTDYSDRAKKITTFFKEHHDQMRLDIEDPNYFRKLILNGFAYKENHIIKLVKADLSAHLNLYHRLNSHIPKKAKILHLADDFGQLDVLLSLQQPQRKIVSYILDDEKRAVAKTNYILNKRSIRYSDNFAEAIETSPHLVLISVLDDKNDRSEIAKIAETIILIGDAANSSYFVEKGFEVETSDQQLVVLKKRTS
jgi:1-acyl-sn-glycerol-3-phosphate acyltransferase